MVQGVVGTPQRALLAGNCESGCQPSPLRQDIRLVRRWVFTIGDRADADRGGGTTRHCSGSAIGDQERKDQPEPARHKISNTSVASIVRASTLSAPPTFTQVPVSFDFHKTGTERGTGIAGSVLVRLAQRARPRNQVAEVRVTVALRGPGIATSQLIKSLGTGLVPIWSNGEGPARRPEAVKRSR